MIRPLAAALLIVLIGAESAAAQTPRTLAALDELRAAAGGLSDAHLREETLAGLQSRPCVRHRAGLTAADEDVILAALRADGLMPASADGVQAEVQRLTVFPPLADGARPARSGDSGPGLRPCRTDRR